MLLISVATLTALAPLGCRRPAPLLARAGVPQLELGLQVDPLATASSVFVLGGFAALQLKIRSAEDARGARDKSVETFRKAEVLLLAGKLTADQLAICRAEADEAVAAHDKARQIVVIPGALLRVPDPTREQTVRILNLTADKPLPPAAAPAAPNPDGLDGVREAMGLRNPERSTAVEGGTGSLLPTGSRAVTPKDVAISIALALQIAWFFVSLTDPLGTPNPMMNAALTSGGEYVDAREARRAAESAEYANMLREAVANGEAPPLCATAKLGDPDGGCAPDAEFARTRGLDADRAFITGPPTASSSSL